MQRRSLLQAACAASVLTLAACSKETPAGGSSSGPAATDAKPGSVAPSIEAITAEATGFNVGSSMVTKVAYVFFDPQCPHCAVLWKTSRPLKAQTRFVWIPVSLLNDKSAPQGATLLAAADPVAAMDEHEALMADKKGGISAMNATDERKEQVKRNTALFTKFGFGSVPTVVAKHGQTGQLVTVEGSAPTDVLAQRLGLNAPAGS